MKNILLLLLGLFATAAALRAQTTLSVQGTVQNFDGSAVENGEYDITFKLYETDAGGTPIWEETQTVNVNGGVYSVLLGDNTPLDAPFNTTYYLGITLPGGPELSPRARLTSSPYALSLIGQDNTFPSTGPVGVGTNEPESQQALHVVGNTKLEGDLEITGTVTGIDMDVDFTNIDTDINTTGGINAEGDITANGGKPVPVATEDSVPLRIVRGRFSEEGNVEIGTGFTAQYDGNGYYTVTFDTPFSETPVITLTSRTWNVHVRCSRDDAEKFQVRCLPIFGSRQTTAVNFIAIGPR